MAEGLSGWNGKDGYTDDYIKAADVGTVSTEEGTAMVENSLKIDSPGGEREENLAGTSIQPHLPGNDVWYGPLRGEQKAETLDIWCGRRMSRI